MGFLLWRGLDVCMHREDGAISVGVTITDSPDWSPSCTPTPRCTLFNSSSEGRDAVNTAYESLPTSTEQIVHPDRPRELLVAISFNGTS